jgi:hypothetical protein
MGKSPVASRLVLGFPFDWLEPVVRPEVQELIDKGHTVVANPAVDIQFGPNQHYLTLEMLEEKYIDTAMKSARARKRGK